MNTRLYRLTPAGGKPNHYTDSYASLIAKIGAAHRQAVAMLQPDEYLLGDFGRVDYVA